MKSWPLQFKVGIYAAGLTAVALLGALTALKALIFHRQVADLDRELTENAAEMFRDLENFAGAPVDPRTPVGEKFIPVSLRGRYVELEGAAGAVLFRSANLGSLVLRSAPAGLGALWIDGRSCRVGTFRHGPFILRVGAPLDFVEATQRSLNRGLFITLPAVAILVFAGGLLLGRRAVQPVMQMSAAAERISAERPSERLPVPESRDEIARLARVLNASFDRLERAYAAAQRFSADASHQLKTPVAVLHVAGEALLKTPLDPAQQGLVEDVLRQARRLAALVEDLILLAQADAGRLELSAEVIDLRPTLDNALDDLATHGELAGLRIEHEFAAQVRARADVRRVALILQNLGENAVKYAGAGGCVRFAAREDAEGVCISVANTGPAIPPAKRERLFDRFHRGAVGENIPGHGLGLNIARALARAHGGELRLVRSDGAWTEFELRLPR